MCPTSQKTLMTNLTNNLIKEEIYIHITCNVNSIIDLQFFLAKIQFLLTKIKFPLPILDFYYSIQFSTHKILEILVASS